ncbi:MAG: hypothetical protein AAFX54_19085 [Pseudomonadota bacterium]
MKYGVLAAPAIIAMLTACTTVQTESAANTALDTAVAADETSTANAEGASEANVAEDRTDMDRIICKRTIPTGTRFGRKECRSAREWREMREAVQSIMDEGQRRNLQSDVPRGN